MDVVITRCAGLDVHQATVVATIRVPTDQGGRRIVTETFGTMAADLLALRDWLQAYGVTHVALESTGVYWKPVYYMLEDTFTLLLINMHALKRVPGRKTDVKDSEWLAQLLECGLLQSSFVPPPPIRELRDLTRYRVQQVRDRSQEVNRLCKVLEDAGLKMTTVITDVMGVSGRAMLTALVAGTTDAVVLADLARGMLRKKLPELRRALQGQFRPHHAFLLQQILAKIDFLDETLERGFPAFVRNHLAFLEPVDIHEVHKFMRDALRSASECVPYPDTQVPIGRGTSPISLAVCRPSPCCPSRQQWLEAFREQPVDRHLTCPHSSRVS